LEEDIMLRNFQDIEIKYKGKWYLGYCEDEKDSWRLFDSPEGLHDTFITREEVEGWRYPAMDYEEEE
jgi:hypothetical protein